MAEAPVGLALAAGFGAAYAAVSLGCTIGPFLTIVVVTFRIGSTATGLLVFLAYAGGMGLAVTAAALAVALSRGPALLGLRRWRPLVARAGGGLLAVTGAYVAYYGWYELRVYSGGAGTDPVIAVAERIQRWLAAGAGQLGVARLALLVGLLAAVPLVVPLMAGRVRRRRRGRDLTRPAAPQPPAHR